LIVTGMRTLK